MRYKKTDQWDNFYKYRHIHWYQSDDDVVLLKLEDGDTRQEIVTLKEFAKIIWQRFKEGLSISECISIFGTNSGEVRVS